MIYALCIISVSSNDGTDSQKMLLGSRSTRASQCRAAGLRIYTYLWIIPGKVSDSLDQDNILFIMVLIEFLLYLLH